MVNAIFQMLLGHSLFAAFWVLLGCASLYQGVSFRKLGVDLTPEFADLRGQRRRRVAWRDVQAVVRHRRQGAWQVQLVLENGESERLRAPTTLWSIGLARYEQDFNVISQWWLAHHGEPWPAGYPEVPPPPGPW